MVFWLMGSVAIGAAALSAHECDPRAGRLGDRGRRHRRHAGADRIDRCLPSRRGLADRTTGVHRADPGVLLDVARWGALPDAVTRIGAAIIVASGLYPLRRERTHAVVVAP
jgi:hypothetical protein